MVQKDYEGYEVGDGHILCHQHDKLNAMDPCRFDVLREQGRGRCINLGEDTDPAILPKKPYQSLRQRPDGSTKKSGV